MMQLILHTTLFINGSAVPYKIYYEPQLSRYYFKPAFVTLRYPSVYAWSVNGQWKIDGPQDELFARQITEDIENIIALDATPLA